MEEALPCRVQKYAAPLLHGEGGVLLSQRDAMGGSRGRPSRRRCCGLISAPWRPSGPALRLRSPRLSLRRRPAMGGSTPRGQR